MNISRKKEKKYKKISNSQEKKEKLHAGEILEIYLYKYKGKYKKHNIERENHNMSACLCEKY